MKEPDLIGFSSFGSRSLYLIEADQLGDIPPTLNIASRHFVCVLVMAAEETPTEEISRTVRGLIRSGCAYLCTWGPGCERVHDLADEELVGPEGENPDTINVITTWHDKEPLSEVLWFALNVAWPAEQFEDDCASTLVISVGNPDWAAICREALRDPSEFSKRVLAEEEAEGAAQPGRRGGRG